MIYLLRLQWNISPTLKRSEIRELEQKPSGHIPSSLLVWSAYPAQAYDCASLLGTCSDIGDAGLYVTTTLWRPEYRRVYRSMPSAIEIISILLFDWTTRLVRPIFLECNIYLCSSCGHRTELRPALY